MLLLFKYLIGSVQQTIELHCYRVFRECIVYFDDAKITKCWSRLVLKGIRRRGGVRCGALMPKLDLEKY